MIETGEYQSWLLTGLYSYPGQVCCHEALAPCIASMFLLSQSTLREDLRSAGVSRFFARPLRYTGPLRSRRGHPLPSCYIAVRYSGTSIAGDSPRAPCSSLAWLLACRCPTRCCLRPRGVGLALVARVRAAWPAPKMKGSARSQTPNFSGLCVRFRATPFTSSDSLLFLSRPVGREGCFTTGRSTTPYPGRLRRLRRLPPRHATIARLPILYLVFGGPSSCEGATEAA